jgi:hypothetical protein
MALVFTVLQGIEYYGVSYTLTDSVFGSTFYMGTGLTLRGPIYTKYKEIFYFKEKPLSSNLGNTSNNLLNKIQNIHNTNVYTCMHENMSPY